MKIGLIIATEEEYAALFNGFNIKNPISENDLFNTIKFTVNEHELFIVRSGIGEIAAASLTQYLITKYNVEIIFNYGACGALKENRNLNDVVIVKNVVHYDFDISQIDPIAPATYPEINDCRIPLSEKIIEKVKKSFPNLEEVTCASGDKFISDVKFKKMLVEKYDCDICDMESAGIVLTCLKNKVDVFSLKGVSDSASGKEYNSFVDRTCKILFEVLKNIIYSF